MTHLRNCFFKVLLKTNQDWCVLLMNKIFFYFLKLHILLSFAEKKSTCEVVANLAQSILIKLFYGSVVIYLTGHFWCFYFSHNSLTTLCLLLLSLSLSLSFIFSTPES